MRKTLSLFLMIFAIAFISGEAQAKSKKGKKSNKTKVTKNVAVDPAKSQLGTSFSFDAASVRGKYQMAGQGIALVEDEKVLDDLLGLRRQFKDREQQEESRW
jgi:hypothetical protein